MKTKSLIIILLLSFSFFVVSLASLALSAGQGLAQGDVFYYEMYGVFRSSNPNAELYIPPFEANNTDWVRIEIIDVSGSLISKVYTLHFKDETEQQLFGQIDIDSDSGEYNGFRGVPICPPNLKAGDVVPTLQLVVNDTLILDTAMGRRDINHVTWNSSLDYGDCYFDKQTGMLVELYREHRYINPETDEVVIKADVVKMINSSPHPHIFTNAKAEEWLTSLLVCSIIAL